MLISIRDNVAQTRKRKEKSQKCASTDKAEEESVVAPPYTIVDPDTVMIQRLYTVVADSAVVTAWRPPDVARLAVFDRYIHGSGLRRGQSDHHPIIRRWSNSKRIVVLSRRERMYVAWKNLLL